MSIHRTGKSPRDHLNFGYKANTLTTDNGVGPYPATGYVHGICSEGKRGFFRAVTAYSRWRFSLERHDERSQTSSVHFIFVQIILYHKCFGFARAFCKKIRPQRIFCGRMMEVIAALPVRQPALLPDISWQLPDNPFAWSW